MEKLETGFDLAIEDFEFSGAGSSGAVHGIGGISVVGGVAVGDVVPGGAEDIIVVVFVIEEVFEVDFVAGSGAFLFLLCEEFAEFRDFPEVSGVGFHEGEESAEAIPAVFGVFVIAEADDESVEESVDGVWAVFERDGVGAAEPLHEEAHGGDVIASFEECGDDLSEAAGGAEVLDVLSPEGDIAGGFAGFAPECEDFGDADGSFDGAETFDGSEVVDGGGGVGVPIFGDASEVSEYGVVEVWSAAGCGFAHGERAGIEKLSDDIEQDFETVIGDGVFAGGEEGVEPLEAKNAPGVSESTALDATVPEVDEFGDESASLVKLAIADEAIEHDEASVDFGFEAAERQGMMEASSRLACS